MLKQMSAREEPGPAGTRPMSPRSMTTGRVQRDRYHVVKAELRRLIAERATSDQPRLPSEEELASHLEVSRATIRSALLSLQKDGVIQRVHGRGTFVNRHALDISANISEDRAFADLLGELGYDVVARTSDIHVEPCPPPLVQILELTRSTDVCVIRRSFQASGEPAVYCIDYVPVDLLHGDVAALDGHDSVFDFIRHNTRRQVRYSVAEIVPVVPEPEIVEALGLAPDEAVMLLRHTHIDESDTPVAITRAYVNDRFLRFSVVRTYTNS